MLFKDVLGRGQFYVGIWYIAILEDFLLEGIYVEVILWVSVVRDKLVDGFYFDVGFAFGVGEVIDNGGVLFIFKGIVVQILL